MFIRFIYKIADIISKCKQLYTCDNVRSVKLVGIVLNSSIINELVYNITMFKAGKVAIIGRPNVGKSTLLNALVKEKVCIVSEKPETTRDNIQGIISGKDFQVVFIDTPGMHRPKNLLGKLMVRKAQASLMETDLNLVLIDAHSGIN